MGDESMKTGKMSGNSWYEKHFCPSPAQLSPFYVGAGDGPGTVMENLHAAPDPGRKVAPGLQEMTRNERQRKEMPG
jgi:hypothetical protein